MKPSLLGWLRPRTRNTTAVPAPHRGQSMVEFALIVPILLILVLFALDFGRVFLGWVTLQNMSRVGANYAALHPHAWANNNGSEMQEYADLIEDSYDVLNCTPPASGPAPPTFEGSRQPGDRATVVLTCDFSLLTPIVSQLVGSKIAVTASSRFPISDGCLANCGTTGGGGTPPAPPSNNCRSVPSMVGLSVGGARNAWVSAGFATANFSSSASAEDWRTVQSQSVSQPTNTENCQSGQAFVFSSAVVTATALTTPKPSATCVYVPDLTGMTVSQARTTWASLQLGGAFTPPTGFDERQVTAQIHDPAAAIGDCIEPPMAVEVVYGSALPPPPPAPCLVPNFANTSSQSANATWTAANFTGAITFTNTNKLPYTIKSQSLVGATYISCDTPIRLSNTGNTN